MAGVPRRFTIKQDVVDVVVKKLDADTLKAIDQNIVVKTQEQMRLLKVKAPQKLTPLDTEEVRAAILLDYIAREDKSTRLDHKSLMLALGMNSKTKGKFFAQLYDMIGNYRAPEQTAAPAKKMATRNSQLANSQQSHQNPNESSIPRLAIRLSSLILDPNGFAVQATQLFQEMQDFVRTLKRSADQLTDIQRFKASYEAACLYHVVAKTQTKKLSRMNKQPKQQRQAATKNSNKETYEQNQLLEMDDILKACPNFSARDFKEVCKHVETLVIEMQQAKEEAAKKRKKKTKSSAKAESKKQENNNGKKRGKNSMDKETTTDSKSGGKKQKTAMGSNKSSEKEPAARSNERTRRTVEMDIPSLQEWRKQVLADACQTAKKDLAAKGVLPEAMTESALLASAADDVLRRFGLLT